MSASSQFQDGSAHYDEQRDFITLDAWKKARLLKLFFYKEVIPKLPNQEKYNLDVQIRKASVSGTANISEGYGRHYYQEGIKFYRVSRASIYELKDQLITCFDFNYISKEVYEKGLFLIEDAKVTLNGYIKFVNAKKNKP